MQQVASTTKLDLVTHPVRLRIVLALANAERTAQQIAASMPDVPTSSIYRHLHKLLDAGLVEVVAERQVRGAVEKTLRVVLDAAHIGPDEAKQMSADDYRRAFIIFFTQLFHEIDLYLRRPDIDPQQDIAGFSTSAFYASDAEWAAALQAISSIVLPLFQNQAGAGRKLRRFATVSLPLPEQPKETNR